MFFTSAVILSGMYFSITWLLDVVDFMASQNVLNNKKIFYF